MLIDSLKDDGTYFKATLIECLKEAKFQYGLKISYSYKTFMRREEQNIAVYIGVGKDPANGWRIYTGSQIKAIVEYEVSRAQHLKRLMAGESI